MNISSLSSNTFQIQINQKLPKIEVNFAQTEQIKQDENTDRFGRKIEYYDYYAGSYGDINIVQKYETKTQTKEEALDEFIARQTNSILGGAFYNSTFGVSDIRGISEVREHTATIEDFEYPTFDSGYFFNNNYYRYGKIPQEYYLNSYANSNLIDTKFGKAELFLDLAGDNDRLGVGSFSSNSQLFRFDSDGNGFVDKNDTYFDKLKIRAYDKDGNEIIKKLSEVVDSINLKDFIDTKSNAIKKLEAQKDNYGTIEAYENSLQSLKDYNPYSIFKAEVRYESMNENDIKELSKLANEDGWIDINSNLGTFDLGLLGIAYAKQGVDGNYRLEELSSWIEGNTTNFGAKNVYDPVTKKVSWLDSDKNSYQNQQYTRFINLYNDYMGELKNRDDYINEFDDETKARYQNVKSSVMLSIEREFSSATGLDFTLDNLQKVKDSFEKDRANTANMLKDTDALTAIKINKNGTFTLKFNSGREIIVNELYKDSGKAFDIELNLNAKFMSEEELNQNLDLSVSVAKVKDEITGDIQTKPLKELGVEIIKKLSNNKFILQTNDNRSIIIDQLYTKLNDKEKDQNSNKNQIDDKEKFYPKPLKIWA
ncbi:response regulator [Campylobacter hyointestinalis subsp. hyointestinalis]|uniref:Response regulator n=1 Tax=Campylobacter hyointestinalis subsp. hyointestinalis TaxID=91352 RepID=A0A9W5EQV7_CAMHY|nr:hypothetical protein [Campylobacter hyointestinalis]CUU67702.1 response regulator [Campylobacter hyointestinalis subsp. hyointestinalis]